MKKRHVGTKSVETSKAGDVGDSTSAGTCDEEVGGYGV